MPLLVAILKHVFKFTVLMHKLLINFSVVDVLKKNFVKLSQCLPHNYLKTIEKMKQMGILLPEFAFQAFRSFQFDTEEANDFILCVLFTFVKSENKIFEFCEAMKVLVEDRKFYPYIESLIQGEHCLGYYVCHYLWNAYFYTCEKVQFMCMQNLV